MSEKLKGKNKFLILIIIILLIGLIYMGTQVNTLKKEVAAFTEHDMQSITPFGPFSRFSSPRWDPFDHDWDPFTEIDRIQKEMNRMFKDSFGRGFGSNRFKLFSKNRPFDVDTDIRETKTHYTITMDIPGMDKAKINVEARDNVLIVSGERNELSEENQANKIFKRERSFGYFSRTIPLPEDAKAEGITAEYKRGVLIVKVPKVEGVKNPSEVGQKIDVI